VALEQEGGAHDDDRREVVVAGAPPWSVLSLSSMSFMKIRSFPSCASMVMPLTLDIENNHNRPVLPSNTRQFLPNRSRARR
jgi:hypothetical protein